MFGNLSSMQRISAPLVETLHFLTGAVVHGRFQDGFANEAEHSSRLKAWLSEAVSCGGTAEMRAVWTCLDMIPGYYQSVYIGYYTILYDYIMYYHVISWIKS